MAIDKEKMLIGPTTVTIDDGVDLGLTNDDGVTVSTVKDWVELTGDRSYVALGYALNKVARTIHFTLLEVTLAGMKFVEGMTESPVESPPGTITLPVKYPVVPPEHTLVLEQTRRDGKVVKYTTTVTAGERGDMVHCKATPVGLEITLYEVGNAADNSFGTYEIK